MKQRCNPQSATHTHTHIHTHETDTAKGIIDVIVPAQLLRRTFAVPLGNRSLGSRRENETHATKSFTTYRVCPNASSLQHAAPNWRRLPPTPQKQQKVFPCSANNPQSESTTKGRKGRSMSDQRRAVCPHATFFFFLRRRVRQGWQEAVGWDCLERNSLIGPPPSRL